MTELETRLAKLTDFWYSYVSCDYHKDRDCHFYINKVWSYGKQPVYRPEHYGYIGRDFDGGLHETYEEALEELVEFLEAEVKSAHSFPKDWEDTKKYDCNYKDQMAVCREFNLYPIELT